MKVIEADHERRYEIPGVPGPARRPVDIDASKTGFTQLRSLRLYRFEAGSVVDGHAEEDEVFVIVTSGLVEMKIGWEDSAPDAVGVYTLTAPEDGSQKPFVAYLPPRSVYQLTPHTAANVAYARATPKQTRSPAVFGANAAVSGEGVTTLLEERTHAEKLRLKVDRVRAQGDSIDLDLSDEEDVGCECLVHVQGAGEEKIGTLSVDGKSLLLQAWQTVALEPGERAVLQVAPGADVFVLAVLAA